MSDLRVAAQVFAHAESASYLVNPELQGEVASTLLGLFLEDLPQCIMAFRVFTIFEEGYKYTDYLN